MKQYVTQTEQDYKVCLQPMKKISFSLHNITNVCNERDSGTHDQRQESCLTILTHRREEREGEEKEKRGTALNGQGLGRKKEGEGVFPLLLRKRP